MWDQYQSIIEFWLSSCKDSTYNDSKMKTYIFLAIEFKIFYVENISKFLVLILHYLIVFVFLEQNKPIAWSISSMYTSLYFIHIQATLVYKTLLSDNSYKSFKKLSNIFPFWVLLPLIIIHIKQILAIWFSLCRNICN